MYFLWYPLYKPSNDGDDGDNDDDDDLLTTTAVMMFAIVGVLC